MSKQLKYFYKFPVVPGGAGYPHILADQLTLIQQWGADYAHHITTGTPGTPGFSDLPTTCLAFLAKNNLL